MLSMLENSLGDMRDKRVLDIGCGVGNTLLPFLLCGMKIENCFGIDILKDKIELAQRRLPGMNFACCSAENIPFEKASFDLVTTFTCLSSILDKAVRRKVCEEAFSMLCPGGWVMIYDFFVNNPYNSDVKAVKLNELKTYFPGCICRSKKLTLLPPLSRRIAKYSMALCSILGVLPFLRTHRLTMFQKPIN